jgi:hypothetical protein
MSRVKTNIGRHLSQYGRSVDVPNAGSVPSNRLSVYHPHDSGRGKCHHHLFPKRKTNLGAPERARQKRDA